MAVLLGTYFIDRFYSSTRPSSSHTLLSDKAYEVRSHRIFSSCYLHGTVQGQDLSVFTSP